MPETRDDPHVGSTTAISAAPKPLAALSDDLHIAAPAAPLANANWVGNAIRPPLAVSAAARAGPPARRG